MKRTVFKLLVFLLFPISSFSQVKEVDSIRLFFLGGQSNMDGFGHNSDLPKSLKSKMNNVWIFHGNPAPDEDSKGGLGIWDELEPGHGNGFSSDGKSNKLSSRFGLELTFAKTIRELYPNEKIAIIKYSKGGTSIDSSAAGKFGSWDPSFHGINGINQYDYFLKTLNSAFKTHDIDGNGKEDILIPSGILWMQGESDAKTEQIALRYYNNLDRLMELIRAALRDDDLPIVIGKISDSGNSDRGKVWRYGELIQYAQEKFVLNDINASIVRSTKKYGYHDPYHYNSDGYLDLGIEFAHAIYKLDKEK